MLRVFEAFAGYGSQRMALRNIGIDFEVVGISEIEGDVLQSYAAIHSDFLEKRQRIDDYVPEDNEEMISYLEEINVPLDYKTFENRAKKLKLPKLKDMYLANKLIKNYGDIQRIDPTILPDFDLFTYSFPCQDISVAGYQQGLNADSGTRSSLLWECCKIIKCKKPKYLMMENVKNLVGCNHKENFLKFLDYLESLGYKNSWTVLNARDYGIPQNRERIIIVGFNKDYMPENFKDFEYPVGQIDENVCVGDILEPEVSDRFTISDKLWKGHQARKHMHEKKGNGFGFCLFNKDSKYTSTISARYYKDGSEALIEQSEKNPRMLTPRECARLQGFTDDFIIPVSNARAYKQFGNSVCIPVIEAVAKAMLDYLGEYKIL